MQYEWPTTREVLNNLYHEKYLDDKQIAKLFGVSTFTIWRVRKEMGIKGINPKKRAIILNPQAEITHRQRSIIMGTLLGDACLKMNSGSSAYLSIGHSSSQKEYILWLYDNLKTICNSPPKPSLDKRGYETYYLGSQSREDFIELRNRTYPGGIKKLSDWWLNQITPLAMAVWYMDDGSLVYANKSKSIFAFATHGFTIEENYMLKGSLLDNFGIHAEVRPSKSPLGRVQHSLVISDDSFNKFVEIVKPHIPPCMLRKMPSENFTDHLSENIKTNIDKNTLEDLYHNKLMTQQEISRQLGVSIGTVRKYMDVLSISPRDSCKAQRRGEATMAVREISSGRFKSGSWSEEEKTEALKLFEQLKIEGFPYPKRKEDDFYIAMIERLFSIYPEIVNGSYRYNRVGSSISTDFCPQTFSMATRGSLSPEQIYNNDEMLMDCILRTGRYAKKSSIAGVRAGLKTYRSNRCVSIFQPSWAVTVIRRLLQGKTGARILDFSSGFGGRLTGAYCSGIISEYVGIDPLAKNISSCEEINKLIQKHSSLRGRSFSCNMMNGTAEGILPTLSGDFDIALTSPPYFDKEIYSSDQTQCYNQFKTHKEWADGWLEPVLVKTASLVVSGGYIVMFATDGGGENNVGRDCERIIKSICGNVEEIKFALPSLEYLRSKGIQRVESAWVGIKP